MGAQPLINRITRNLNLALFAIQNLSEDIIELEEENKRLEEQLKPKLEPTDSPGATEP